MTLHHPFALTSTNHHPLQLAASQNNTCVIYSALSDDLRHVWTVQNHNSDTTAGLINWHEASANVIVWCAQWQSYRKSTKAQRQSIYSTCAEYSQYCRIIKYAGAYRWRMQFVDACFNVCVKNWPTRSFDQLATCAHNNPTSCIGRHKASVGLHFVRIGIQCSWLESNATGLRHKNWSIASADTIRRAMKFSGSSDHTLVKLGVGDRGNGVGGLDADEKGSKYRPFSFNDKVVFCSCLQFFLGFEQSKRCEAKYIHLHIQGGTKSC